MSARKYLNPDQFRLVHEVDSSLHSIDAFHPGFGGGAVPVGQMLWDKQSGAITNINVDSRYRRQGIANRMYQHAQQFTPQPLHNTLENRTDLGKKWSKGVGGPSLAG